MRFLPLAVALPFLFTACSPLKTSPHDEKHQMELTVHEVRTNLDDLKHDINCIQTELQILDGRIKSYENALASLKKTDLEQHHVKIESIVHQLQSIEKRAASLEKAKETESKQAELFFSHANETAAALLQFKDRLQELEEDILSQNRRFDEVARLKGSLESIAKGLRTRDSKPKTYKVRPGDSLEKIAKAHKTSVDQIKKLNGLSQDLIVVGQEIKIPQE